MNVLRRTWSSAEVRSLLERSIRSDADLNAFCLDYFPDVYRRFGSSMERVEKINLLLTQEPDLGQIVQRLSERFPEAEGRRAAALAERVDGVRLRIRVPILLAGAVLVALLAAGLMWRLGRLAPSPPSQTPMPTESVSSPAGAHPKQDAVPADHAASPTPGLPERPPRPPLELCGKGNLNASCNSIQAAPGSQININAQQGR